MNKTYAEKRFFEWHKDEVAVSLRYKSGSYGGGSEVLVVYGFDSYNQQSIEEVSPTLKTDGGATAK